MRSTAPLLELFEAYATRKRLYGPFFVAGRGLTALTGNETPASLGLVDGSTITVGSHASPVSARSGGLGGLGSYAPPGGATAALAVSSGLAAPRAALTVRSLSVQRADSGRAALRVPRVAVGGDGSGLF